MEYEKYRIKSLTWKFTEQKLQRNLFFFSFSILEWLWIKSVGNHPYTVPAKKSIYIFAATHVILRMFCLPSCCRRNWVEPGMTYCVEPNLLHFSNTPCVSELAELGERIFFMLLSALFCTFSPTLMPFDSPSSDENGSDQTFNVRKTPCLHSVRSWNVTDKGGCSAPSQWSTTKNAGVWGL